MSSSLIEQLDRQLGYLENSANLFDEGDENEAIRLAVTARVLLHDTSRSKSLLKLLGIKSKMRFLDTAKAGTKWMTLPNGLEAAIEYETEDGTRSFADSGEDGLVEIGTVDGKPSYIAPLQRESHHALVDFGTWWDSKCMDSVAGLKSFSRKDLVSTMANKDGGAHVDPAGPPPEYRSFTDAGLGGWFSENANDLYVIAPPNLQTFGGNAAALSMRQIAFELLETLRSDSAVLERRRQQG